MSVEKDGFKKIRYAIAKELEVDVNMTESEIAENVNQLAEKEESDEFIWCDDNKSLFQNEKMKDFTEEELNMIKFSLEYLHNADLRNRNNQEKQSLENAMDKLGIKYTSQL